MLGWYNTANIQEGKTVLNKRMLYFQFLNVMYRSIAPLLVGRCTEEQSNKNGAIQRYMTLDTGYLLIHDMVLTSNQYSMSCTNESCTYEEFTV